MRSPNIGHTAKFYFAYADGPSPVGHILRIIEDTRVVFLAKTPEAQQRMVERYGAAVVTFAAGERDAILAFLVWAVRNGLGLPDDPQMAE